MLVRNLALAFITTLFFSASFGQRSANWFFGFGAGIKFTPTGVVNQAVSAIQTDEGCSSLSDTAGNLLFYTDGLKIWNKNHLVMANGSGLQGHPSSSQSSIVVPKPGSDSLYYVFTANLPSFNTYYTYNVVDMSKQGGLGEVVEKNTRVGNSICSERITAVAHSNKQDYWIITNPNNSDSFKVFLLTAAGLQQTPVFTARLGAVANSFYGMLKASPDGTMVVHAVGNGHGLTYTQLFRFDASTGVLSNLIKIPFPRSYGCAFSPDSRRLYLNNSFPMTGSIPQPGSMAQFTVSVYDSTAIANSKYLYPFSPTSRGGWGDLSAGPDTVMYVTRHSMQRLSGFKKPNDSAAASMFVDTLVNLTGVAHYGLPNFYNNINIPPNISIKMDRLSCLRFQFSFNTNYSGTGVYTWDLGDGNTSSAAAPVHTYNRNGIDSFLVKFHFKSTDGAVDIKIENWLKLPPKPVAAFTLQTDGCIEKALTLTNSSSSVNAPLTYYWNFGDGTTSSTQLPVKNYTDTGSYLVKLHVTDNYGCESDTVAKPAVVNKKAIARFGLSGPYCTASGLAIADTSVAWNTTISQWRYDFGDRVVTSPTAIPVVSYTQQGAYNVRLVINTAAGCVSDTISRPIDVFAKPSAGFTLPQSCVTDLSSFNDTSSVQLPSVINKWRWYFDDPVATNDTSLLQHTTYQYSNATNYNVQLVVTTDRGCIDTLTQQFTVNGSQPHAALTFVENQVCGIDSVQLVNASTVNFGKLINLQIDWGTGFTTDTDPVAGEIYRRRYALFGTPASQVMPIKLMVQSGISCLHVLDTFITIKAQPQVQLQPFTSVCSNGAPIALVGGSETMGAAGSGHYFGTGVGLDIVNGGYRFTPSAASGPQSNIGYLFITPGGCVDSASATITLLPKPEVDAGPDKTILLGNQVVLNATASGTGLTYLWSPAKWLNADTILQPSASPTIDTTFWIVATNADNCSDSSAVFVRVLQPIRPSNVFSPNGDGINELWSIPNIETYPNSIVQVFTRWGQLVFQSRGYQRRWDGNSTDGKPLPVGTYYYMIAPGEGKAPIGGWVQLLR